MPSERRRRPTIQKTKVLTISSSSSVDFFFLLIVKEINLRFFRNPPAWYTFYVTVIVKSLLYCINRGDGFTTF